MKLKKIITMGLAAIMAVSAMSISAFADGSIKKDSEEVVMSVLAEDGKSTIELTRADLANGKDTIVGYNGVAYTYLEDADAELAINVAEASNSKAAMGTASTNAITATNTLEFNSTNVPGIINAYDVYNSNIYGEFDVPSKKARFSDHALKHRTNTKALLSVKPYSDFDSKVAISLCEETATAVVGNLVTIYPEGTTTQAVVASGITANTYLYGYINNKMTSTASGNMTIYSYN